MTQSAKGKADLTDLHWAARFGDVASVESLIATGSDINARDKDGRTPLHWAAESADCPLVELLIANGADVNAEAWDDPLDEEEGESGETPWDMALKMHYEGVLDCRDVLALLQAHGARWRETWGGSALVVDSKGNLLMDFEKS